LLAPSVIEGFGLPIAEALVAGCRIVCSDIPAFRELAANSCQFVTLGLGEEESFAAAICEALRQPRPDPIALPQFSADAIAASCLDLYRSLYRSTLSSDLPMRSSFEPTKESQPHL
jgi:glycosyltransferase involved in cell wall biosynthesis